jgi:hypothetical protein
MKLTAEESARIQQSQRIYKSDAPTPPHSKEPLFAEGNLATVYSSKSGLFQEVLSPAVFNVSEADPSTIDRGDLRFVDGVEKYFESHQPNLPETFFIVNVGHAHLPGVATTLLGRQIEPYFYLPDAHPRIKETLKYWSTDFQVLKEKQQTPPLSHAMMLDIHRQESIGISSQPYDVIRSNFPDIQYLKSNKIKNIVVFGEFGLGKSDTVKYHGGLDEFLTECIQNKILVLHYGIDMRQKIDLRRFQY